MSLSYENRYVLNLKQKWMLAGLFIILGMCVSFLLIPSPPKSEKSVFKKAHLAYEQGNYHAAIDKYTEAIRLNPTCASYYAHRGYALRGLARFREAIEDLTFAIEIDPGPEYYEFRGLSYRALGELELALMDFDESLCLEPGQIRIHQYRGDIKLRLGRDFEAIADYDQAIKMGTESPNTFYLRGWCRVQLPVYRWDLAEQDFTRAIDLDPDFAAAFLGRAKIKGTRRYQSALADLEEAIGLMPQFAEAYGERGILNRRLEKYQAALTDLNRAIDIQPENASWYIDRAWCLFEEENLAAALRDLDMAIALQPGKSAWFYQRSLFHKKNQNYDTALADMNKVIALEPGNYVWYFRRGELHHEAGNYAAAILDYNHVLAQDPDNVFAQENLKLAKLKRKLN